MTQKRRSPGMLVPCDLPWTESYELDEAMFVRLVERLAGLGYGEMYVMGTAGEGYALTDGQFRGIVDVFLATAQSLGVTAQIGVIALSQGQVSERIDYAHERGARSFQISLPSWSALSDAELLSFFQTVCGAFPDASFLHYNLARTKRVLSGEDYRRLAATVPNLVATKQSSSDMRQIRDWMLNAPELQHFFVEPGFPYACLYGECSLLPSYGGLFPGLVAELYATGRGGDLPRAFAIQRRLFELHAGFFGHLSRRYIDGAYDNFFDWLVDPEFPRRLLPPYESISDADAEVGRVFFETHCGDLS